MKIAVVMPAYNESQHIAGVLRRFSTHVRGEHEVQLIVVDDGSRDGTAAAAKEVDDVRVIRHRTNLGKGAAAKTGCDAACYLGADIIALMDSDGQHKPEDLERMVAPLLDGARDQMIIGTRDQCGKAPFVRRAGNIVLRTLARHLFGIRVTDSISGYRAFSREYYPSIRWGAATYEMEIEMSILAARAGLRFTEVGIETIYLDGYKGMSVLDGLRIMATLVKWRLLWYREYSSLESFSV